MASLTMYRGDTRTIVETIQPLDASGNQVLGSGGITGWSFWMTVKYDPGDADASAVFQKTPGSWTITQAGNLTTPGIVICVLAPGDTSSLPGYRVDLSYDVQAKDPTGNIFTIDSGLFTVLPDTTRATS